MLGQIPRDPNGVPYITGQLVGSTQATVTTAGTELQLADHSCISVTIKAKAANTGNIFVGGSDVSSATGLILAAGEAISLDITNTNLVYIDSATDGDGVSYIWIHYA